MGLLDIIGDASSKVVRGYTSGEKYKESLNAPYPLEEGIPSPEAERYAAQRLAARAGRPAFLASLFNQWALLDPTLGKKRSKSVKEAGEIGYLSGQDSLRRPPKATEAWGKTRLNGT